MKLKYNLFSDQTVKGKSLVSLDNVQMEMKKKKDSILFLGYFFDEYHALRHSLSEKSTEL